MIANEETGDGRACAGRGWKWGEEGGGPIWSVAVIEVLGEAEVEREGEC